MSREHEHETPPTRTGGNAGGYPRVGLALGGGGVRGLAHVRVLEALDELGVKPAIISGTSIGAIVGALYSAGSSGAEIRSLIHEHIILEDDRIQELRQKLRNLLRWLTFFRPARGRRAMLSPDGFLHYLLEGLQAKTFEELEIPLITVATDFHAGAPVHFRKGPLLPALKASMAIPGVFEAVEWEGRLLIDGGVVENLPWSALRPHCDIVVAVDVMPSLTREKGTAPRLIDTLLGAFDIMIEKATLEGLVEDSPELRLHTDMSGVRILDFDKSEEAYRRGESLAEELIAKLPRLLGGEASAESESGGTQDGPR